MALAVNGSGTIFKKCDRSNHRPDSNKGCASSTCQHTCDTPERGQHAWTLRYWVNGKQVEKSFKDKQHPTTGRVDYRSGKKLARDWQQLGNRRRRLKARGMVAAQLVRRPWPRGFANLGLKRPRVGGEVPCTCNGHGESSYDTGP